MVSSAPILERHLICQMVTVFSVTYGLHGLINVDFYVFHFLPKTFDMGP